MSEELKPCPFCRSEAHRYYPIMQHDDTEFYCCSNDDCIEPVLIKELWNTRPLEDALRKQLEEITRSRDGWEKDALVYAQTIYCQEEKIDALRKQFEVAMDRLELIENHKAGNHDKCEYCWDMKICAKEALAKIKKIGEEK
jgi:hypothetical protein